MHTSTNILEDNVRATQHAGISTSVSIYRTIMAWWYFSVSLISHELRSIKLPWIMKNNFSFYGFLLYISGQEVYSVSTMLLIHNQLQTQTINLFCIRYYLVVNVLQRVHKMVNIVKLRDLHNKSLHTIKTS